MFCPSNFRYKCECCNLKHSESGEAVLHHITGHHSALFRQPAQNRSLIRLEKTSKTIDFYVKGSTLRGPKVRLPMEFGKTVW